MDARDDPHNEPRNGIIMCPTHHTNFDHHRFYIRFIPDKDVFVFINHSNNDYFQQYHGKAIALDIKDPLTPFASLFLIHEWRVRGFNPFQPIIPLVPVNIFWQDWVDARGVFDEDLGFLYNTAQPEADTPEDDDNNLPVQSHFQPRTSSGGPMEALEQLALPLNKEVIASILVATRAQPSCRACQMEPSEHTSSDRTVEVGAQT